MSAPLYSAASAWTSPLVMAGRVRDAMRTGSLEPAVVDAIATDTLMRDVAISELLVAQQPEQIAADIATQVWRWHPTAATATLAAAVTAPMSSLGNYGLAAGLASTDPLGAHIDDARANAKEAGEPVRWGDFTATTAFRFVADGFEKSWPATGFDPAWNGFAAPRVDQETLEDFFSTVSEGFEILARTPEDGYPSTSPVYRTWSTIDLADGERPPLEDALLLAPTQQGDYPLAGYMVTRVAEECTEPLDVWNAVEGQVQLAEAHWRASRPPVPVIEGPGFTTGPGTGVTL